MAELPKQENKAMKDVLVRVKRAAKQVAGFSFIINLLLLVSPIYMLQLYDRVLSSGSGDTLLVLSIIALFFETSSSLDIPGFRGSPTVITTTSEPSSMSYFSRRQIVINSKSVKSSSRVRANNLSNTRGKTLGVPLISQ